MNRIVRSVLAGLALAFVMAAPAGAQELGGGVTVQNWNGNSKGFGIDFTMPFKRGDGHTLGVVVDFARNRFTDEETDVSFAGGVRMKFTRNSNFTPFAQFLVGVMRWDEDNGFDGSESLFGPGGGIQVRITDRVDVKGQFDVFWVSNLEDTDVVKRGWFGVVVKLGNR